MYGESLKRPFLFLLLPLFIASTLYFLAANPLCRVASIDFSNGVRGKLDYDKEKYKEMILDAAETVLGYFRFDRTVYRNKKNTGPRKWRWLQELKREREQDIKIEKMEKQ